MIKKLTVLFAGSVLAIQFAGAQIETGTSSGAQALDRARSAPVAPNAAPEEEVVVVYDAKGVKEVFIEEVPEKMWSLNVSTGWDSLYMFRGANVLGNNNGLYWVGGDLGVSPWEGGSVSAGFWYAVGTSNPSNYQELNVFADITQSVGNFDLSLGWINYSYPVVSWELPTQNEIYLGAAYNIEIGSVSIAPSAIYFYNVGPVVQDKSYLLLGIDASVPLTDMVSLDPWFAYGVNFGFNTDANGNEYDGSSNVELGVSMPVQITDYFSVAGYIAYSHAIENNFGTTDANTFWGGVSANFSF